MPAATFDEALAAVERLAPDDQETLIEIVRRRLAEQGRLRVVASVRQAREEFKNGECQATTPDELMREILS